MTKRTRTPARASRVRMAREVRCKRLNTLIWLCSEIKRAKATKARKREVSHETKPSRRGR